MQAFFISLSNMLSQIWDYLSNLFTQFFALLESLIARIGFVIRAANLLPANVKVPAMCILGVMLVKFLLSFGKQ